MRVRQPEQPLAEMPHNRVFVQKLLIVKLLRQQFFARSASYNRALIGEHKFFGANQFARLFKQPRLPDLFHIEQQHARIYVIVSDQIFAVMVVRRGVLVIGYIDIVKQTRVAVEHYVGIEIQNFVGHFGNKIGKQPYKRVRRTVRALIGRTRKIFLVKLRYVNFFYCAFQVVFS